MKSSVSIFPLWLVFYVLLNISLLTSSLQSCFSVLSLGCLTVSPFTFRSIIYPKSIFLLLLFWCEVRSSFIVFHMAIQLTQHYFFENMALSHCSTVVLHSQIKRPYIHEFFPRLFTPPLIYLSIIVSVEHLIPIAL